MWGMRCTAAAPCIIQSILFEVCALWLLLLISTPSVFCLCLRILWGMRCTAAAPCRIHIILLEVCALRLLLRISKQKIQLNNKIGGMRLMAAPSAVSLPNYDSVMFYSVCVNFWRLVGDIFGGTRLMAARTEPIRAELSWTEQGNGTGRSGTAWTGACHGTSHGNSPGASHAFIDLEWRPTQIDSLAPSIYKSGMRPHADWFHSPPCIYKSGMRPHADLQLFSPTVFSTLVPRDVTIRPKREHPHVRVQLTLSCLRHLPIRELEGFVAVEVVL